MPYFILFGAGALIHGSLYLLGVIIAGIWLGHPGAVLLAITTMGVTYLSFTLNLFALNRQQGQPAPRGLLAIANGLTILTILLGISAGILLLS